MNLCVREQIGPRCLTQEGGQTIYNAICAPLLSGEEVTLDFEGVAQFASPFFNFAVGQLLKDLQEAELRRLLHIVHLNETGQPVLKRVVENAAKYHGNEDYRKIVDQILEETSAESG